MNGLPAEIQLEAPGMLWLLALLPLLVLLRERSPAGRPPWRSFGALVLRSLALCALILAAARPVQEVERPDRSFAVVVDASASLGPARQEEARRWLRAAWQAKGEAPGVVVVAGAAGGDLVTGELEEAERALAAPGPSEAGTDLRSALEQGLAALPPARHRELALLSDGVATRGRVDEALRVASARDLPVHAVPVGPAELRAAVVGIEPEQDRTLGREASVRVELEANAAVEGRLELIGPAGSPLAARAVRGGPGRWEESFVWTPAEPGVRRLVARLSVPGDPQAEDDELPALVRVRPRPAALVVGRSDEAAALRRAVQGFRPELAIEAVPELPPPPYDAYRLLVLLDPDLKTLGAERAEALAAWTRGGGRLLVTGGEDGLVTDDDAIAPLSDILPVRFPKTKKQEQAPLAVVYCLDASDSMAGSAKFELAAAALANSLLLLPEQARAGVVTFSDLPTWAVPLARHGGADPVIDALSRVRIRGGTSIFHALQAAYEALKADDALVKHVVLLSDGQSTTTFARSGDVVRAMAQRSITVTTIAVSPDSDRPEMERIARAGRGRAHYTESFRDLPQLFLDEMMLVTRTNKVEEEFAVHPVVGARLLAKLGERPDLPPLNGYVRGEQRAGSELALATADGHPVLAAGREGRGVVVLFTSDVGGPWSERWRSWKGHGALWEGVLEAMLRPEPPDRLELSAVPERGGVRLAFSVVDAMRNPRGDLRVEAVIEGPERRALLLPPTGPGRYGGFVPRDGDEPLLVGVAAVGTTEPGAAPPPGGELLASVPPARPDEVRAASLNEAELRRIAERTGGLYAPEPAAIFARAVPSRIDRVPRWPLPLQAALLLLLLDLCWRRARLPR